MLASKTLSLFSRRLSLTGTRGINGKGSNEMKNGINGINGISGINETRGLHTEIPITHRHEPTGMMNDMISSGTHSSSERIHKFMNAIYVNKPRQVSLFSFNYRQQTERSTVRGICIGTNSRAGPPQRNVVVVAGLPLQDASLIGVGLYVAAMAARLSPMMARDVSVIPLAYPREYERRWRGAELANVVPGMKNRSSAFSALSALSTGSSSDVDSANWLSQENVTIDLQNNCKPLETYITRRNKYFINLDANLTAHGSSMQYKSNSLPHLSSRNKSSSPRDFFLHSSPVSLPLPSSLSPSSSPFRFEEARESLIAPILNAPAIVLELKGTQALDDNQVVARGEEVIRMLKELVMD